MQHGTSAKSHWINYILLWKNEIYSGKHLENTWKNGPERLCEPWSSCFYSKGVLVVCRDRPLGFVVELWDNRFNSQTLVCLELHFNVIRSHFIYDFPDMEYHVAFSSSLERKDL